MILKQTRVKAGGAGKLLSHITNNDENDVVTVLNGNFSLPENGDIIAQMYNRKYGNRHVVISPQISLTNEQLNFALTLVLQELRASDSVGGEYLLIQHDKKRHDNTGNAPHFHLVINETMSTGEQLDQRMTYVKNEKIARLCELEFNHPLIKGRHNLAVIKLLENEGLFAEVNALKFLKSGSPALAAFGSKQLRKAERYNVNLPLIYYRLREISDPGIFIDVLKTIEVEQDINSQLRVNNSQLLISKNGQVIANVFKFIKEKDLIHAIISKLQSQRPGI